jgi:hypothetical protein
MALRKIEGEDAEPTLMGGTLDQATEVGKQSESVQAGISNGDIVALIKSVKRNVEGKPYEKQYLQLIPMNLNGALAIAGGVDTTAKIVDGEVEFDGPCLVKDFFYGNDLGAKSRESQKLAVLVEGPDKAKQAAAKQLAKAYNITEAEALAKIEKMGL